jgi:hypothetical protein
MPSLPSIPSPTALGPELRIGVGLVAAVLLLQGARFYRVAVVAPGLLGGLAGGLALSRELGLARDATLVISGVLAVAGGVICHLGERLAVVVAGMLGGVAATVALEPLVAGGLPWWAPIAGATVGGVLGPFLHRAALPILTAVVGAPAVAWAAQWPMSPVVIGGLVALGVVVQWMTGGSRPEASGSTRSRSRAD